MKTVPFVELRKTSIKKRKHIFYWRNILCLLNLLYQEISGLEDIPVSDALKILYEAGMMCVHTKLGTFSYSRENPLRYDFDTWKESMFELQLGLWKKSHIW